MQFQLPREIGKGDVSVSVKFNDGGSIDTIVRPVPVVVNKLEVEFFPEGGDMIAGVPNRVYFQSRTTLGKPAEIKGRIVDETNAVACDVETSTITKSRSSIRASASSASPRSKAEVPPAGG